jgi:lipopolysaccharide export system protein LptA
MMCLLAITAYAQVGMEVKGFKVTEYYPPPHERQLKSLLEGDRAQPQADGRTLIMGSKLQTFTETGEPELLVEAPECWQDPKTHSVNSAGPLHAQTADGKFSIEGEGFYCQQTNSSLFISNHVHTVAQGDVLATTGPKKSKDSPGNQKGPVDIFSQRFNYTTNTGLATYQGNVQVKGTNLSLTAETLTLQLPLKERQLQHITADKNVVIDYTPFRATGEHAVYATDTGLAKLTGHPAWRAGTREGHGDELIIDQTNEVFFARGNAFLKMPASEKGTSSFLPEPEPRSATQPPSTNVTVEFESDSYELRTNSAHFNGNVRVTERADAQVRGRMLCGQMAAQFRGTNELERMVAENNVVIEKETGQMYGGRAVYTADDGRMVLTQKPGWQAGERSGKGDQLIVDARQKVMTVQGKASMRMPAAELARTSLTGGSGTNIPRAKTGTNQFAEIYSERYDVQEQPQSTNGSKTTAVFHGGVYITHPQMYWTCETLTVQLPQEGGQIDHILADQAVMFDLVDEQGGHKIHGTGEKSIYNYSVVAGVTNSLMHLFGTPAKLETTNGTVQNNELVLDLANGELQASGAYAIRGTAPALDTNKFQLPNNKFLK